MEGKNIIRFDDISIIQTLGDYDRIEPGETIGVKARVGDRWIGFWFNIDHMPPEEIIYALGQSLLDLAVDPFHFNLGEESITSPPLELERISPAWGGEEDDEIPVAG